MYNCLILGAGSIAAGYDTKKSSSVLTHAHAITKNKNFKLSGFYDINLPAAQAAAKKWGAKAFKTLQDCPLVDIAVICTPDHCHLQSLQAVLKLKPTPKLVILEKPLSDNLKDAKKILAAKVPVAINFSRRYVVEFEALAKQVKDGVFGVCLGGSGVYTKGFIHNGSHMLDLLKFLSCDIKKIEVLSQLYDYTRKDPTKTTILHLAKGGKFFMRGLDSRHYSLFELDLIFSQGRIKILDSGKRIETYLPKPSAQYKGYNFLHPQTLINADLDAALPNLYINAAAFLQGKQVLKSTPKTAFEGLLYV